MPRSVNTENLSLLRNAKSRCISPENRTGAPGAGAMAEDGPCKVYARDLGRGWKISPCVYAQPGETIVLADIEGPGAIQTMWFTGRLSRDYILRIYWDHQQNPSVETPMTDFFGCGWYDSQNKIPMEFAQIDSALIAHLPNHGLNCFFHMPFRKHCLITLENIGDERAQLYYQINYELCAVSEDIGYFHATFRRENPVQTAKEYTLLDGVSGRGHLVGVMLNVGINGPNLWWGEGEVKFFIDDDREFPTICATGTEDYFGGAWGWSVNDRYTPFSSHYLGVHFIHEPSGGEDCQQRFSMYRWHVLDPIRFEKALRVTIQDLGWRRNGTRYLSRNDDFSSVVYWYQTLPGKPLAKLLDRDALEVI